MHTGLDIIGLRTRMGLIAYICDAYASKSTGCCRGYFLSRQSYINSRYKQFQTYRFIKCIMAQSFAASIVRQSGFFPQRFSIVEVKTGREL